MKLTKYQKEAIVRAIFQDVPHAKSADIHAAVQKAIVAAMSPTCRRAYVACPKALRTTHTYAVTFERDHIAFVIGDADFDAVLTPWVEARDTYFKARERLTQAVESCTTLKQLNEMLPEFAAYFPTEGAPTKNLPAVANLVADLMKLGWKAK